MTCLYAGPDIIISLLRTPGEEKCIRTTILQDSGVTAAIKDLPPHIRISGRMVQKKRAGRGFVKTLTWDQNTTVEIKTGTWGIVSLGKLTIQVTRYKEHQTGQRNGLVIQWARDKQGHCRGFVKILTWNQDTTIEVKTNLRHRISESDHHTTPLDK